MTPAQHTLAPRRGFTLIELIGVLAIIAILVACLVPAFARRMDEAARTREKAELGSFATGLQSAIVRAKSIPSSGTWATTLSTELSLSVSNITTTPRGRSRAFLLDGSGWFGTNTLPFIQTSNGISPPPPFSARLMIVSTLGPALPLASGTPSTADFNDIWNTPERAKPSAWTNWAGNGDEVLIQRLNVEPLFRRLLLVNADYGAVGKFTIETNAPSWVPLRPNGWDRYYIDGTVVGLLDTNSPPLVSREILRRDISFVFENGFWREQIQDGLHSDPYALSTFAQLTSEFLEADKRPRAKADQSEVVTLMYEFMFNWVSWAEDPDICFNAFGGKETDAAQEKMMLVARDQQKKVMERLIKK